MVIFGMGIHLLHLFLQNLIYLHTRRIYLVLVFLLHRPLPPSEPQARVLKLIAGIHVTIFRFSESVSEETAPQNTSIPTSSENVSLNTHRRWRHIRKAAWSPQKSTASSPQNSATTSSHPSLKPTRTKRRESKETQVRTIQTC